LQNILRRLARGKEFIMRSASVIALILASASVLTACGAETATTAATVGAAKKQELEQGKQTLEQV
jgi:predicted small secreted protein